MHDGRGRDDLSYHMLFPGTVAIGRKEPMIHFSPPALPHTLVNSLSCAWEEIELDQQTYLCITIVVATVTFNDAVPWPY